MNRSDVIGKLQKVMRDVFDNDEIEYRDALTAADVEGWDSLSNVRFLVAVEQAFRVRITATEIAGLNQVGDLVDLLAGA
jgi:acyl carrier protein